MSDPIETPSADMRLEGRIETWDVDRGVAPQRGDVVQFEVGTHRDRELAVKVTITRPEAW